LNRFPTPSLSRRALLRNGGIAISLGAVVAACGSDRGGPDAPGRLGVAEPAPTLPTGEINDVVLLRTAQSIEYTALDVYAAAVGLDVLSEDETELIERFARDHQEHADRLGELISGAGGEPFTCANPFLVERVVTPVVAAIGDSDDQHRDVIQTAYALETFAGASYQALTSAMTEPELRVAAITIGTEEHRHAAALALAVDPDNLVNPELTGGIAEPDADGFPVFYAVPSTFGQLTGVPLTVGSPDEEGARLSLTLQTPAENTYVYDYLSCDA
jgi:rubrerythrin